MFSPISFLSGLARNRSFPSLNAKWVFKEHLDGVIRKFELTDIVLEDIVVSMSEALDNGLSKAPGRFHRSPLKMIVSYVRSIPNGSECGTFYAIDLGGTHIRILQATIGGGRIDVVQNSSKIDSQLLLGTGVAFFDFIADALVSFVKEHGNETEIDSIGFTFSFPVNQSSLTSGRLITWTKGFAVDGVEGEDVVQLLKEAIQRRSTLVVKNVLLLNDTVGVMLSGAYDDPEAGIGLIVGTGSNACYMEKLSRVQKWVGSVSEPSEVIINTEWGAFGEKGELAFITTEYDRMVDSASLYPGEQWFEKMISGMYLGELARRVLLDLAQRGVVFDGCIPQIILTPNAFKTSYISEVESGDLTRVQEVIRQMGCIPTENNVNVLQDVCRVLSLRAAKLTACGLASIIKRMGKTTITIAADGSMCRRHPTFSTHVINTLKRLVPGVTVRWMLSEDGSGRGAALLAAKAKENVFPSSPVK